MVDVFKFLPLITMVGGAVASKDNIEAQVRKVIETTQVMATQTETDNIVKMIHLDFLDNTQPKPADFANYVRDRMQTKNGSTRDTSVDYWGTQFRLVYIDRLIVVASAGPDKSFGSSDDVISSIKY